MQFGCMERIQMGWLVALIGHGNCAAEHELDVKQLYTT